MMILCADHRNAQWLGSGALLARLIHIRRGTAHAIIRSLSAKGYIGLPKKRPALGNYPIVINKYNKVDVSGTARWTLGIHQRSKRDTPEGAERDTQLQEVGLQEEKRQEASRKSLRIYPREFLESKAKAEALVGKGPEGKMQTKYDTLMQALRAGTAEPTKENLMRARNIVRSEFAFNSNERQLASEWLAKNSEAKTA